MNYFLRKIKNSFIRLIYIFAAVSVLSFGTLPVAAQSNTPDQFDPQKFAADEARRVAQVKEEWRPKFAELDRKIESNPKDLEAIKARASLYMGIKEDQKAIDDYSRAVALKPDDIDSYSTRAVLHALLGQYDLAIADYTQIIKLDSHNYEAYLFRSTVYFRRQMYDAAIADLTSLLKFKPDDEVAYQSRSMFYFINKQYKEAIADYTRMIELDARSIYGYSGRAEAYKALGDAIRAAADRRVADKLVKELDQQIEEDRLKDQIFKKSRPQMTPRNSP